MIHYPKLSSKKLVTKVHTALLIFGSLLVLGYSYPGQVLAENLKSNSYYIQFSNLNVTSGEKSSASYGVTDTVGQTGSGAYSSTSYGVGSGFQYIYQIGEFSFTISDVDIDLGELVIGQHSSATNTLTINTRGGDGYTVYAYELHPLLHSNGTTTIADTTCNAGTCSESTAQVWTTQTIPGFGFNITGNDTPADFTNSTYFRQFADISNSETMKTVMSSSNVAENRSATVTYKVGVTSSQGAGRYQTGIVYVAVPGF